jgi:hypothetical protein
MVAKIEFSGGSATLLMSVFSIKNGITVVEPLLANHSLILLHRYVCTM